MCSSDKSLLRAPCDCSLAAVCAVGHLTCGVGHVAGPMHEKVACRQNPPSSSSGLQPDQELPTEMLLNLTLAGHGFIPQPGSAGLAAPF